MKKLERGGWFVLEEQSWEKFRTYHKKWVIRAECGLGIRQADLVLVETALFHHHKLPVCVLVQVSEADSRAGETGSRLVVTLIRGAPEGGGDF